MHIVVVWETFVLARGIREDIEDIVALMIRILGDIVMVIRNSVVICSCECVGRRRYCGTFI